MKKDKNKSLKAAINFTVVWTALLLIAIIWMKEDHKEMRDTVIKVAVSGGIALLTVICLFWKDEEE